MKRHVCPRCGSSNIDWIIPQVWSKWVCKDCSYTGPAIEADDDLVAEIKADWEENKEKYLEEENIRAQQILSGEDEILDDEMEIEEEDELTEEELDKKLRELNLWFGCFSIFLKFLEKTNPNHYILYTLLNIL